MKIAGEATLDAPVEKVWDALLDPAVLVATIPGCERLVATGENAYDMTVTAGVASIKGTYGGTCALRDLDPHSSLRLIAEGSGGPGTIAVDVRVTFQDGDGTTTISYDADASIGGMIAGVGQRMLASVGKRMAAEFFGNVERALSGEITVGASGDATESATPGVATTADRAVAAAPARAIGGPEEFLKGIAVGAGLVLLGVAAGVVASRRS